MGQNSAAAILWRELKGNRIDIYELNEWREL